MLEQNILRESLRNEILDLLERFRDSSEVLEEVVSLSEEDSLSRNDISFIFSNYKELLRLNILLEFYNKYLNKECDDISMLVCYQKINEQLLMYEKDLLKQRD